MLIARANSFSIYLIIDIVANSKEFWSICIPKQVSRRLSFYSFRSSAHLSNIQIVSQTTSLLLCAEAH